MTRNFLFLFCFTMLLVPEPVLGGEHWLESPDTAGVNSHLGVGAVAFYPMYFTQPYTGWELYWTVRPSAAKYFVPSFERYDIGFEVNVAIVDMTALRGFVDGSLVFHKYLNGRDGRLGNNTAFVGAGIGIVGIRWNSENVTYRDVSFTVEMGYEHRMWKRVFITLKAQARYLEAGPINFNGGGAVVAIGWHYD